MDAIAMAVFGGISSTGGKGNLAGGIISAFIIVCLRVGLGQQNLHPQVILLILGLLLICAVALPNVVGEIKKALKVKEKRLIYMRFLRSLLKKKYFIKTVVGCKWGNSSYT